MTALPVESSAGAQPRPADRFPQEAPFPVTVEVRGITEPARFAKLSDALTALLGSLRALPLDAEQRKYFDDLFGPDAVPLIEHRLTTFGQVRALAYVGLTAHVIKVCPADPGVCP